MIGGFDKDQAKAFQDLQYWVVHNQPSYQKQKNYEKKDTKEEQYIILQCLESEFNIAHLCSSNGIINQKTQKKNSILI